MSASKQYSNCAGKPTHLHGVNGREYATGRGVMLASRELLRAFNMGKISGKTFVIQVRMRNAFPFSQCLQALQYLLSDL